jgi:hypothetical protein
MNSILKVPTNKNSETRQPQIINFYHIHHSLCTPFDAPHRTNLSIYTILSCPLHFSFYSFLKLRLRTNRKEIEKKWRPDRKGKIKVRAPHLKMIISFDRKLQPEHSLRSQSVYAEIYKVISWTIMMIFEAQKTYSRTQKCI